MSRDMSKLVELVKAGEVSVHRHGSRTESNDYRGEYLMVRAKGERGALRRALVSGRPMRLAARLQRWGVKLCVTHQTLSVGDECQQCAEQRASLRREPQSIATGEPTPQAVRLKRDGAYLCFVHQTFNTTGECLLCDELRDDQRSKQREREQPAMHERFVAHNPAMLRAVRRVVGKLPDDVQAFVRSRCVFVSVGMRSNVALLSFESCNLASLHVVSLWDELPDAFKETAIVKGIADAWLLENNHDGDAMELAIRWGFIVPPLPSGKDH